MPPTPESKTPIGDVEVVVTIVFKIAGMAKELLKSLAELIDECHRLYQASVTINT
jgi:hypothetical protein